MKIELNHSSNEDLYPTYAS